MTESKIWLPFSRAELIRRGRCPDCGCHPDKQGHKPDCPTRETEDRK
ncbi:hypothetical protein SEA_MISHA28_83 [Mycobacterium phage Misha28]|nr:hypothetical protein SEA_MISHA28_83 [Mycobacterium phage Misha28]AVP42487.1 hypothetical protein SEA_TOOTSIEPOP_83 [Mycobacterium phage TootsiePop]QKO03281.1 hypothetical protein SEA_AWESOMESAUCE_84 [Mycobacterium phage Awesomesauce]